MKSYLRFLSRNKLYAAIMAVGLSIAIAFIVPMICYYNDIREIAKGHDNYENIYSVCYNEMQCTSIGFGDFLKETVPEIEKVTNPVTGKEELLEKDKSRTDFIDKEFFYFFPCKFIEGDESFLDIPGAVAISADYAKELASDGKVLGMQLNGFRGIHTVAAVYDNYGSGVLYEADMLANIDILKNLQHDDYPLHEQAMTLISVRADTDKSTLLEKIRNSAVEYWGSCGDAYRNKIFYSIVRYDEITTDGSNILGRSHNSSLRWILGIICMILFIIPLLNYINLSVALTIKRAKEMAMRRLNGADKRSIIVKYCVESLVFTSFCFLFGLALTELTVPTLNQLIQSTNPTSIITLSWTLSDVCMYIVTILLTSLLCGIVPALMASHFTPLDVTKGDFRYHSKKLLSKIFICFQSVVSVVVIVLSLVMEINYNRALNVEFHCNVDDVFYLDPQYMLKGASEELSQELLKHPEILSVGLVSHDSDLPGIGSARPYIKDHIVPFFYTYLHCDENAFNLMEFEVIEQFDKTKKTGLWMTADYEKIAAGHPEILNYVVNKGGIRHQEPAGRIETYPVSIGEASTKVSMLFVAPVSEITFYPDLVIKTIPDHNKARKVIAEAYSMVYDEQVTDLMNFSTESRYIKEIHEGNLAPRYSMLKVMRFILILIIGMTMMGLVGMSLYYSAERKHEISVRKVFGGTTDSETFRNVTKYMKLTLIADLIAVPFLYFLLDKMKETSFANNIDTFWWIYVVAIIISCVISLVSVLWQTLHAARTNPVDALKKE